MVGAVADFSSRSWRSLTEHRQRRRSGDRKISDQSRRGLDWTNFFLADVQMSFGSFLAFYLAGLGWSKQDVGLALTVGGVAGAIALVPGGALADAVRWKRGLVAAGIISIGFSSLILALWPSFVLVMVAELLHGLASGALTPVIGAISLGLAGRAGMSLRVGRNYRFSAAGNVLTAAAMGALGAYASSSAIFIAAAVLCVPTLIALTCIRADEIDYARARNAARRNNKLELEHIFALAKNRSLVVFAIGMVMFHFANASILPLVSQNLGQSKDAWGPLFMAGLIIVPQIAVALLAPWIGYWSEIWGRKPLLLVGLVTAAARAMLFAMVTDPYAMMAVQVLDGIIGAIATVLTTLVITDLTAGTGRFNVAQGVIGMLTGAAAGLSGATIGFIATGFGDLPAFLTMGTIAFASAALLWVFLPETKPAEYDDSR
jgi:MFS family permease